MRHHEPVLAMRLKGYRPSIVTLNVDWNLPRDVLLPTDVVIEPADVIPRLDLRFLIGCGVFVLGESDSRVDQAFEAARKAGANRITAGYADGRVRHFAKGQEARYG